MRRRTGIAVFILCTLLAVALGYGVYLLSRLAPIGTAYAAKTLCSGVFVAHRSADDVIREDVRADNHPLLRVIHPWVESEGTRASATFLGFARRDAVFHAGRGCALWLADTVPGVDAQGTRDAAVPDDGFIADTDPKVDAGRIRSAMDWAFSDPDPSKARRTRAVVILHRGRLLSERYAQGFSAQTAMLGWSMTKSIAGILIGVLVKDGKLALERNALLPQWRDAGDARAQITLDQLLRMTSGLRFTENYGDPLADVALMLFTKPNAAAYAIAKPLEVQPGTRWRYSSGTSNILAELMRQAIGGSAADYLAFPRRALFEPLGMRHAVLEADASGTFITSSYMYASPYDWSRFGQLLLQDGIWDGKRIVPEGWVQYMRTLTPQSTRHDFGAHLWTKVPPPFNSASQPPLQLPAEIFHAVGHEGQFVSVIPSRQLVVVRLGLSRGEQVWDHDAFLSMLLAAVPP
jgi:CubicO group peptidase (beta-lactamase class C family)